jgi:hypothetical protein
MSTAGRHAITTVTCIAINDDARVIAALAQPEALLVFGSDRHRHVEGAPAGRTRALDIEDDLAPHGSLRTLTSYFTCTAIHPKSTE